MAQTQPIAAPAIAAVSAPTSRPNIGDPKDNTVIAIRPDMSHASAPVPSRSGKWRKALFFLPEPVEDPSKLSRPFRLVLLGLLVLCASIDPIASMGFYPVLPQVARHFNTSLSVANLCSSLDFAGVAATSLWWSYASRHGRRKNIFVVGLSLVVVFGALGASATSIGMLIATRVLASASAAGIIITGIIVVRDMWETKERGFALGIYFLGPIASPMLGPILGGAMGQRWGWRAIPAFIAALAGVCLVGIVLLLPETKSLVVHTSPPKASNQEQNPTMSMSSTVMPSPNNKSRIHHVHQWICQPLLALKHLRHPIILLLLSIAATSYAFTTIFCVTQQSMYSRNPYNYDTLIIGLLFLPYALGAIVASLVGGKFSDYIMRRHAKDTNETLLPENRIRGNAFVASALQMLSLPSLGWAFRYGAPWPAFIVPAAMYGASAGLNMGIATAVLVEVMPAHAAGLMALNSMGRNLSGAIGGSVAQPLIDAIGVGWLYTGLFGLALCNLLAYITIRTRGRKWREKIWRDQGVGQEKEKEKEVTKHPDRELDLDGETSEKSEETVYDEKLGIDVEKTGKS